MVKNKNIRDFALVIFMLVVVIAFVVYQFIPSGNEHKRVVETKTEKNETKKENKSEISLNKTENKVKQSIENNKKDVMQEKEVDKSYLFINELELILINAFDKLNSAKIEFNDINLEKIDENMEKLLSNLNNEQLMYKEGLIKINKYDLITLLRNYKEFNNVGNNKSERFILFLSVFLKNICKNNLINDLMVDKKLLTKYLNFDFYEMINFEVEKPYQFIPVLFYLRLIVNHSQLFKKNELVDRFVVKLEGLKDLTSTGFIQNLILRLHYVSERIKVNISWLEEDKLDPDDKGEYIGVNVRLYKNLGLEFLVFPDVLGENKWIKELINADKNSIEIKYLWIEQEELEKNSTKITLFFNKKISQFFILFGDINNYLRKLKQDFLDRLVYKRIQKLRNSMNEVVISKDYQNTKLFSAFSIFLKSRISKIID